MKLMPHITKKPCRTQNLAKRSAGFFFLLFADQPKNTK